MTLVYIYIYIYIICVCVCVCMFDKIIDKFCLHNLIKIFSSFLISNLGFRFGIV